MNIKIINEYFSLILNGLTLVYPKYAFAEGSVAIM